MWGSTAHARTAPQAVVCTPCTPLRRASIPADLASPPPPLPRHSRRCRHQPASAALQPQPPAAAGVPAAAAVDAASLDQRELSGTVVVTGAGPAGLAAAVALHMAGMRVLVLERDAALSTAGSALGLWTNAWRALDALGAADALRRQHPQLHE